MFERGPKIRWSLAALGSILLLPPAAPARPVPGGARTAVPARAAAGASRAAASVRTAPAPSDTAGWDGERVMALVDRAIEARRAAWADSSLHNFEARVEAHVYFLAGLGGEAAAGSGAPAGGEPSPGAGVEHMVRADQLALRVRWKAPAASLQTIVGRRSEKRLPTRIRYHIDHLSLVLENFGRRIRIGEGTEVRDVLHPVAPGATSFYRYRLADSLGIEMPGRSTTVYRVQVRPRDPDRPGVVGSVFLDGATGAVARMRFTFTPSAYRDPTVASITVDLRSALHDGRWWLPAEQWVDIRRSASWLAFPLTGVIRTHLEVRDLRVNVPHMPELPEGGKVVTLGHASLHRYDRWSDGLYDDPAASGLRGTLGPEEVRSEARRLVGAGVLGGRGRVRPSVPDVSSAVRARRSEGLFLGAGARWRVDDVRSLEAHAGWPFEARRPEWRLGYAGPLGGGRVHLEAYGNRFTDIGPFAAAVGVVASTGFVASGEDFTDPYFRSGARLAVTWSLAGGRLSAGVRAERQRRALLVALPPGDEVVRPVRPIREGDLAALQLGWRRPFAGPLAGTFEARADLLGSTDAIGDFAFTRAGAAVEGRSGPALEPWGWEVELGLAAAAGSPPPQALLLLGGRGTVPGYPFRAWGGDHAAFGRLAVSHDLVGPWVRLRAIGAAGWAGWGGAGAAAAETWRSGPPGVGIRESRGVRTSLGCGVGIADGLIRVEAVRGLDGGVWEWMVSVDPRLGKIL